VGKEDDALDLGERTVPPTKNSLAGLLANLDADFKLSCPKCKSRNVHVMTEKGIWSEAPEYSFACYTCGLRKYGEGVIYGLVEDLRHEWNRAAKERAEEKARKAEEESEKARLRDAIARYRAEQRIREEAERKEAEAKAAENHRAWLAEMERRNAEPRPQPVVKPAPAPPPKPELEPGLPPEERRRQMQALYRDANRERRRENDRLRRVRLREAREAEVIAPLPEPTPEPTPEPVVLPVIGDGVALCAWESCGNPARENSKYCSRNCSNKNARSRSKDRKG